MIVPIFPESNPIRIIQTNPVLIGNTTFKNRLMSDENWLNVDGVHPYVLKFSTEDTLCFQFRASHSGISVKIFDYNYNEVKTLTPEKVFENTSYKIYNVISALSDLSGKYYVQIQFTETGIQSYEFSSEWFQVSVLNSTLPLLKWDTMYSDGIFYSGSESFMLRIEANVHTYEGKQKQSTFTTYNNQLINSATTVQRLLKFTTDFIPRYVAEILNWASGHENFYINGLKYVASDEPKIEETEQSNQYSFTGTFQEFDYGNYFDLAAVKETSSESITVFSFDGSTDAMSFDGSDAIKVYNNY